MNKQTSVSAADSFRECWSDFSSIYRVCVLFVNEAIKQNYAIAQSSSYQNEEKILQIFIQPIHLNQSQV